MVVTVAALFGQSGRSHSLSRPIWPCGTAFTVAWLGVYRNTKAHAWV